MKNNEAGLESLKDVMAGLSKKLGIEKALKETALIDLWPQIVGPRFENNSKAYTILSRNKQNILVVATSSSVVSQELSMFKNEIIKKIYKHASNLDLKINDILFNTKIWGELNKKEKITENTSAEKYTKSPTEEELNKIEIPENLLESIKNSLKEQTFSSDSLKERMLNLMAKDIKIQIWKKNNGFPSCAKCGVPVNYVNFGEKEVLCPACKYL
ncbi:MAG: DciA family protein [Candidatus Gastranaerophilaceae bacterium]